MMAYSIKRFLFFYLVLILIVGYIALGLVSYLVSKDELDELYDANLEEVGMTIAAQRSATAAPLLQFLPGADPARKINSEEHFIIRIYGEDHGLHYISHPQFALAPPLPGLSTQPYQGRQWRSYALPVGNELVVVTQSLALRDKAIHKVALSLLVPLLVFIPILGLLLVFTVIRGLQPLTSLSQLIQHRAATDTQPVSLHTAPVEIMPLLDALNRYITRSAGMISVLRQFTSDAAHELRTPLTALKLQLGVLERARSDAQQQEAIQQLHAGIDRSTKLVQQLLTMARVEPGVVAVTHLPVDVLAIARQCIEQLLPLAHARQIDMGLDASVCPPIQGDAESLRILVSNLLDNAIRYTAPGGSVDLVLSTTPTQLKMSVRDTGIGIAPQHQARVFDRFYRAGQHHADGSGLGLAIVKEIASQHGADLQLHSEPGAGTRVELQFPLTPPAEAGTA